MPEVYLCSGMDDFEQLARRLHNDLTAAGFEVWWNQKIETMLPGSKRSDFKAASQRAKNECRVFVICFSQLSITRKDSLDEIRELVGEIPRQFRRRLVDPCPVRYNIPLSA